MQSRLGDFNREFAFPVLGGRPQPDRHQIAQGRLRQGGSPQAVRPAEQHQRTTVIHKIPNHLPVRGRQRGRRQVAQNNDRISGQLGGRKLQGCFGINLAPVRHQHQPVIRPPHIRYELEIAIGNERLPEKLEIEAECVLHIEHPVAQFHHLNQEWIILGFLVRRRIRDPQFVLHHASPVMGNCKCRFPRLFLFAERHGGLL